ncbi:Utr2 GPI anchored cell wall putative glycosidase [Scheffersomyces xylosifermentans]|uniref:Utr2 GPI anchored cell wall putative glycosidase n=1 Tax=Scheffersomyces xylosifermentans TaxID=1304137 RepID=UPI00315D2B85
MRQTSLWTIIPTLLFLLSFAVADDSDTITCGTENQVCPESAPCCSQYGVCGTGAYCLGGCDTRFSFNSSSCMPMPRMSDFDTQFNNLSQVEIQNQYLGNASESDWVYTGWVDIHDDALLLQMPANSSGTVVSSTKYLWYGKVSATFKTSHDRGVITAFILYSDVKDEIDFEFVGYNLTAPQSNFYALGILNYTNAENSTTTDTFENYHTYMLDWTEEYIKWYIDDPDHPVRTLNRNDTWNTTTKRYDFPQTPSRIQFSLWPGGGAGNGLGTIEWAGGEVDWDSEDIKKYSYYYAYLKEVKVETYDLPANVKLDGSKDADSLHAFYFDSDSSWDESDVGLTNRKTWLGSSKATGFNPQNAQDPIVNVPKNKTSTIVTSKGTSKITQTTTIKQSATSKEVVEVPGAATTEGGDGGAAASTTNDYNPSGYIGGFVQNSKATPSGGSDTTGSSGSSGSSNDAQSYAFESVFGLTFAIGLGIISFFI